MSSYDEWKERGMDEGMGDYPICYPCDAGHHEECIDEYCVCAVCNPAEPDDD